LCNKPTHSQHLANIGKDEMDESKRRIFEENISGVIIYLKNKKTLKMTFSVF
jgi:hypothetical protein